MTFTGNGYLVRATALEEHARAFAVDASAVVAELQRRHGTEPAATAALGRTATAALLLAATLKDGRGSVTLRISGDGPGGALIATATPDGDVRGLIANPRPDVEQVRDGKLNVAGVVGTTGKLSVVRDLGMRYPYSSSVAIVSGEIGQDVAHYLAQSEQIPAAIGIGVFVRTDGSVEAAGGYMIQLMPGLDPDRVAGLEHTIARLPHPTTLLRNGDTPESMLKRIFPESFQLLQHTDVRFHCPCSRQRAEAALIALGTVALAEIREDAAQRGFTNLTCEFCGESYRFSPDQLSVLTRDATSAA